jgi:hypothetical protein
VAITPERVTISPEWVTITPEQVAITPEWVTIASEWVMWITAPKWVIMSAQLQVNLTTHEWVNAEKAIVTAECIRIAAQWRVNLSIIDQVCKLVMQTDPNLFVQKCIHRGLPIALETIPTYQEVSIGGPLFQKFAVLHQSYSPDYFSQPISQYPISDMHGQFITSMTVDHDGLSDGFFKSFIQHLVHSHAVQLSIYIYCHGVMKYYLSSKKTTICGVVLT